MPTQQQQAIDDPTAPYDPGPLGQPRVFFNHIPKCAGTSLIAQIAQAYPVSRVGNKRAVRLEAERLGVPLREVEPAEVFNRKGFIYAHANIAEALDESWQTVCVLRDPVRRLRSLFNHWQTFTDEEIAHSPQPEEKKRFKRSAKDHTLESFLAIDRPEIRRLYRNGMAKQLVSNYPTRLHERLEGHDLVEAGARSLEQYACVGLVENLDDFVRRLCFLYSWPAPFGLAALNVRGAGAEEADATDAIREATELDAQVYQIAKRVAESQIQSMTLELIGEGHKSIDDAALAGRVDHALSQRARAHLVESQTDRPREGIVSMESPIRGAGWLEREGLDLPRIYRWTGEGTVSTAELLVDPADSYEVELDVVSVLHHDTLKRAEIEINETPMQERELLSRANPDTGGEIHVLRARVTGRPVADDGYCRLTITVPHTASHEDFHPGCGDFRQKGLAIQEIRVRAEH